MFGYLEDLDTHLYDRYCTLMRNIQAGSNSFYDAFLSLLECFLKLTLSKADIAFGDHETCGEMLRRAEVKTHFLQELQIEETTFSKMQDYVRKVNQHKHRGEKHVEPDTVVSYMRVFYDISVALAKKNGVSVILPFSQTHILSAFNILENQNTALKNERQRIEGMAQRIDNMSAQMDQINRNLLAITLPPQSPPMMAYTPPEPPHAVLSRFIKRATKEYRWFGDANNFAKLRLKALLFCYFAVLLLAVTSILVTICCELYTTYTLFEHIWMILLIYTIVYLHKAERFYPCDKFAENSFYHFEMDQNGVYRMGNIKARYIVFFVLFCISVVGNMVMAWEGSVLLATLCILLEASGAVMSIYAFFMRAHDFFSGYQFLQFIGPNDFYTATVAIIYDPILDNYFELAQFEQKYPFVR